MKLIIAGSRTIPELSVGFINRWCPPDVDEIVSGLAYGPDKDGVDFAHAMGMMLTTFEPDWKKFGKGAGFVRNEAMAAYADSLLAFWDGKSHGTHHMITCMEKLGKPVKIIVIKAVDSLEQT